MQILTNATDTDVGYMRINDVCKVALSYHSVTDDTTVITIAISNDNGTTFDPYSTDGTGAAYTLENADADVLLEFGGCILRFTVSDAAAASDVNLFATGMYIESHTQ